MRSREEIKAQWEKMRQFVNEHPNDVITNPHHRGRGQAEYESITMEVLLDIRDILREISEDVKTIVDKEILPKGGVS